MNTIVIATAFASSQGGIMASVIAGKLTPDAAPEAFTAPRGYIAIPFDVDLGGSYYLTGRVGENTVHFLIDTGANHSLLSERTVADSGLKPELIPNAVLVGPTIGTRDVRQVKTAARLGDKFQLPVMRFNVVDLTVFFSGSKLGDKAYHGVIGSDVLSQYAALIDCRRRRLYLYDPSQYDSNLWQGEWQARSLVRAGQPTVNVDYVRKFRLTVKGTEWRLAHGEYVQAGELHVNSSQRVKSFGITGLKVNGVPTDPPGYVPKPGEYDLLGVFEIDSSTLRFATSLDKNGKVPGDLVSTKDNRAAVFTFHRVPAPAVAKPVKP